METVGMLPSTARSALTKRKEGAVHASAISSKKYLLKFHARVVLRALSLRQGPGRAGHTNKIRAQESAT